MLAVLACILDEPRTPTKNIGMNDFGPNLDHSSRGHRSLANAYYPSEEVARNHFRSLLPPESSMRVDSQKIASGPHSANSSGPLNNLSASETPPSIYKPSRTSLEHRNPQSTSLSTSPEHYRHTHRSNSNLSALAASFSRPFSFGSAASSPPTSYPKKRSSPVGSYLGTPAPTFTWSAPGLSGRSSNITEDPKSSPLSVSDAEDDIGLVPKKPVYKTKLKNQDQFPNDGYANVPLLDPSKEWCYRTYREAYANLLYIWGMPVARAEILSHNRPLQPDTTAPFKIAPKATAPFSALAGANLLNSGYNTENSNPVFRDHCPSCSTLLLPSQTPSFRCQSCSKFPPALLCLLCNTSIRGLSSPCPSCGHVLHASCRQLLSQASLDECPSGCGCICADYTTMAFPSSGAESEPPREEEGSKDEILAGSPAVTVTGDGGANEQEQLGWNVQGWEDVAYESLSRNLQARTEDTGKGRKTSK